MYLTLNQYRRPLLLRWNATPKFYLMDHQSIMSDAYMYMQKQSKIKQKRYNAFNHVVV